jgi:hypothetical protein
MTNKQKKEKKLTFLNHVLAPTFLAQNPKNKEYTSVILHPVDGILEYMVHSTYANILKNIYRKVKQIVGIG